MGGGGGGLSAFSKAELRFPILLQRNLYTYFQCCRSGSGSELDPDSMDSLDPDLLRAEGFTCSLDDL